MKPSGSEQFSFCRYASPIVAPLLILIGWLAAASQVVAQTNQPLWRLGKADNSAAEFSDYITANPEAVTVPTDWATRTSWSFLSKGLRASTNPAMTITFNVPTLPANGVLLSVKVLHADRVAPEMAVFSNGVMAGLIQLWGTGNVGVPERWRKTYQLYIPKELLQTGSNVLRLEASRPTYSSAAIDPFLYWEWDYLSLAALTAPATEPIHGKLTYMGTSVKLSGDNFSINDNVLATAPIKLKWMGVAHSGNTVRADYWSDIGTGTQPRRLEYLQLLRDLNMTVIADHLNSQQATLDASGNLSATDQTRLTNFFTLYGSLFQYYEIDNEPGLFNRSKAVNLAIGRYVNQIKPGHVKTTAPGWAYWPTNGNPAGWERDPAHRRDVENLAQATNGHSYGLSYADAQGGSFAENLETYGSVADGWSKEYVNTEMGTDNGHQDFSFAGSSQPNAAIFDRITRGHVAVTDRFMHHATTFGQFSMFNQPTSWTDPTLLAAYPGISGQDTRLKTWRRLALAYATHGSPLKYEYLNKTAITGKKVYFRGVNTATLTPLPGSGGQSNKVLLNFVNFESSSQTMTVRVTLPGCGVFTGERIGAGDTYSAAFSTVSLTANPTLDLTVTLGARESVQYILTPPTTTCSNTTYPTGTNRLFIEAESGQVTAPMQVQTDVQASVARYITVAAGNNSADVAPTSGIVTYSFTTAEAGAYQLWGRVSSPNGSDDSFWVKLNNGNWIKWNGAAVVNGTFFTDWRWGKVFDENNGGATPTFNLNAGTHTLQVAYREDGAKLDQWLLTNEPTYTPSGDLQLPSIPGTPTASGVTASSATLNWTASTDNVAVTGYEIYNGEVLAGSVGATTTTFVLTGLSQGSPYRFTVRATDAAGNRSPASNAAVVTTAPTPRADLIITAIGLQPTPPTAGQRVSLRVTVRNQGAASTPPGTPIGVSFRVNGSQVNFADRFTEPLAAGATAVIVADNSAAGSTTWNPSSPGSYTVDATVDDVGRISEDNEANNSLSTTVAVGASVASVVTLTAPADKATFELGDALPLTASATSSGVSRVEFFANGTKIGEDLTSPYSLNWTPTATGTYGLVARSTYTGGAQTSSAVVVFVNPVRPDLVVTDISWAPANATANSPVRFTAVVRNQGRLATPANVVVGVSFFIKRNGANTSQTYSDTYQTAIQPGTSVTLTANGGGTNGTYTPTAARTDTVEAFVDDINRIAERDEANNKRTEFMTVGAAGGRLMAPAGEVAGLLLFPVPAQDVLVVRATDPIEAISLMTLTGSQHSVSYQHRHEREVEVDVSQLATGIYLVSVRTSRETLQRRVLVQH